MSSGTQRDDTIVTECEVNHDPATVWRALTEPELVARWLVPGNVSCQVIAAEPERLLRCSWRGTERDAIGNTLDTVVTFELSPTITGGTRLRIVHEGFGSMATPANDNGGVLMMRAA